MGRIAVVDDRREMRESVAEYIRLALEDLQVKWEVEAMAPLASVEDYVDLIEDGGLRVLVLDENLSEDISETGEAVGYSGHQVARFIRSKFSDLPQVIITSIGATEALEGAAELDAIVQRDNFNQYSEVYVERMVRLGQSFSQRYEKDLADLAEITTKLARGEAGDEDRVRLDAIRETKVLEAQVAAGVAMTDWIDDAERIHSSLRLIIDSITARQESQ